MPPPTNGLPDAACNMRGSGRVKKKKVYPTTRGSLIAPPPPKKKSSDWIFRLRSALG